MQTPTVDTISETSSKQSPQQVIGEFGNGKYSQAMLKMFNILVELFSITEDRADKIVRQFAIDYGAAMKNIPVEVKLGKANADNKGTLSELLKVKGITYTNALNVARATQWIADAGKNGVSYGKTQWQLSEPLLTYVNSLDVD